MKKHTLTLLLAALLLAASCKKDEENPSSSKKEMLTAKSWKGTALTIGGTDFWGQIDACSKDDLQIFKADGTYIADEGATKCDPGDPQQSTSTWFFIANETQLVSDGDTATIKELTSSKMVLTTDLMGQTAEATFVAQ